MRVCCISYKFSPAIGGAEKRAEKQSHRLHSLGHEVIIVTLRLKRDWKRVEVLGGLPVIRIGGIYKRDGQLRMGKLGQIPIGIGVLLALWQMRHHYDVIHAFQIVPPSVLAALFSSFIKKPIIISAQSAGPDERQLAQLRRLEDGTLINASGWPIDWGKDWAICGSDVALLLYIMLGGPLFLHLLRKSQAFYQALSTRCYSHLVAQGFSSDRIIMIPGSVDTEKFYPVPEKTLEHAAVGPTIMCIARLAYGKGIDVLLHAWAIMMHDCAWEHELKPNLHLVGVGSFKLQLECMARELGIQDSVQFLGLREDVVFLLQQSWGFVLPSRWEGMPNALLEAMACGLPCVATRVSGSEDIITDGVNGLLVEPERPEEMAHALRHMLEDADFAARLGQEGRKTVVDHYQLTNIVEQCLAAYRYLLKSQKGRSREENTFTREQ
jgi:glycosyltransferase involved in cell wall biosynthesis